MLFFFGSASASAVWRAAWPSSGLGTVGNRRSASEIGVAWAGLGMSSPVIIKKSCSLNGQFGDEDFLHQRAAKGVVKHRHQFGPDFVAGAWLFQVRNGLAA